MINHFGKILVRNPLLPYQTLFDSKGKTKDLRELAHQFMSNEPFIEGVYWSSIPLYKRILAYKKGEKFSAKKEQKLLLTIAKYAIRASTRSTPYGTFAGISAQNLDGEAAHPQAAKRHLRIDMRVLKKIIRAIESDPILSTHISYHLNNTLYSVFDQYRFLEVDKENENKIQISSLEKTEVLGRMLSFDHPAGFKFDDFYPLFSNDFTREELALYFNDLIATDFLVSALELRLTDEDPFQRIKDFLRQPAVRQTDAASKYLKLIERVERYAESIESKDLGNFKKEGYKKLETCFDTLAIPLENDPIFHVDLAYQPNKVPLEISDKDFRNIKEAITVLGKLISTEEDASFSERENFKRLFREKYETKAVPLLEVLDPDLGIGFPPNKSIGNNNDNFFKIENEQNENPEAKQNLSEWLIDKIENLASDYNELRISTKELKSIEHKNHKLSNSFYAMGQVVSEGNILLQNVGGVAASTLLSRFAYMHPEINALCKTVTDYEKELSKEVVFADIAWVPGYKSANIAKRIVHTDYEIPIYYPASKDADSTIYLQDLLVSIVDNDIVLSSQKLQKRVVPRLSHAHNFRRSNNPIYKFLCFLQHQGESGFVLKPDFAKHKKRTFPQIFYKNIILFPAHWILQESDIQKIKVSSQPLAMLKAFFEQWKVCQYVSLIHADNELFMDTQNDSYLEILLGEIKNQKIILLKEWLHDPKNQATRHLSQFILPLNKNQPIEFKKTTNVTCQDSRTFFPGNDWVYFKIYCGTNFSDLILELLETQFIAPLLRREEIEKWFFIRFTDPHHHIRLRLHKPFGAATGNYLDLLNELLCSYIKQGIVWKIALDTYQREMERYGISEMQNSEKLFYIDSQFCIDCLKKTNMVEDTDLRLLLAAKNVDYWLTGFSFDLEQKKEFCETMENSLKKEKNTSFLNEVKSKYRTYKMTLNDFMADEKFDFLFEDRKERMKSSILSDENLPSYIHMSMNRWFANQQRDWEYLVYYFCAAYYRTTMHINSKK